MCRLRCVHEVVTHARTRRDRSLFLKQKRARTSWSQSRADGMSMGDRSTTARGLIGGWIRRPRMHVRTRSRSGTLRFDVPALAVPKGPASEPFRRAARLAAPVKSWFGQSGRSDSDRLLEWARRWWWWWRSLLARRMATACRGVGPARRTAHVSPQKLLYKSGAAGPGSVVVVARS